MGVHTSSMTDLAKYPCRMMMGRIELLVFAVMSLAIPAMTWNVLQTTFRLGLSDRPPQTEGEAESQGWQKLSDCQTNERFAGSRWLQPVDGSSMVPDKVMIYDAHGQIAGMQSIIPIGDFVNMSCTENEYYAKELINSAEFCVTTMYFTDPAFICNSDNLMFGEDQLFLQRGTGYQMEHLVTIPKTYDEAKGDPEHWNIDKWFPFMGHHTTGKINRDDCKAVMPIQGLYAWLDGECRNTGFVWSHVNTKTQKQSGWEKPSESVARKILNDVHECMIEAAKKNQVTTMHVYLGGSTKHCSYPIIG